MKVLWLGFWYFMALTLVLAGILDWPHEMSRGHSVTLHICTAAFYVYFARKIARAFKSEEPKE